MSYVTAKLARKKKVDAIASVLKQRIAESERLILIGESANYIKYTASNIDYTVIKTFRYKFTMQGIRHERLSIFGDKNQYKEWTRIKTISIKKWYDVLVKKGLAL